MRRSSVSTRASCGRKAPVYFADLGVLLFSDVPGEKIFRYVDGQEPTVFRQPSGNANGNTRDRQGRLLTCESGNRRVTRTEYDGRVTVLAERYEGKRLNSPNDIVVSSDDAVWFTDPDYGILSDYTGNRRRVRSEAMRLSDRPEERRSRDRDGRTRQAERPRLLTR